jgi:hypothetical protein
MGEVVETSFHPINGKHGKDVHGGRLSAQSSPVNEFSCKAHTGLRSRLIEECKCRLVGEMQTQSFDCSSQGTLLVVASFSEYKYSVLIFC